jgi:hypothetical protein
MEVSFGTEGTVNSDSDPRVHPGDGSPPEEQHAGREAPYEAVPCGDVAKDCGLAGDDGREMAGERRVWRVLKIRTLRILDFSGTTTTAFCGAEDSPPRKKLHRGDQTDQTDLGSKMEGWVYTDQTWDARMEILGSVLERFDEPGGLK